MSQCDRKPTGCGDVDGVLVDGTVIATRVHSVFVTDNAKTKVPPADLDQMLPMRFNVWTIKMSRAWRRAKKESDGCEVDPSDKVYLKRRKEGDPDPTSLEMSADDVVRFVSGDDSGKTALRAGYISEKAVHQALHPSTPLALEFWADVNNDNWKNVNVGEELRIKTLGKNVIVEYCERLNAKTVFGKGASAESEQVASGWGDKLLQHAEGGPSSEDERSGAASDEWD